MPEKDITYNPAQADQYIHLMSQSCLIILHIAEEEDPMPCFAMTNPMKPCY